MTKKKRSLRNEKPKANRASETEEQKKERLRIRRENEKIENQEKQHLSTLKRLKRGEVEENWRRWSLANSLGWSWRQKKKEEQDWNDASFLKSWQLCLSFKLDVLTT